MKGASGMKAYMVVYNVPEIDSVFGDLPAVNAAVFFDDLSVADQFVMETKEAFDSTIAQVYAWNSDLGNYEFLY